MKHTYVVIEETPHNVIWECPICKRKMQAEGKPTILVKGDNSVPHETPHRSVTVGLRSETTRLDLFTSYLDSLE